MRFSIVTPSYNQGRFIERAIQGVLDQHCSSFEHIVVDNCSDDETSAVIGRYPHLVTIVEPDQGQADALNKGFQKCSGELIGWLNADDYYAPGYFECVDRFFRENPRVDIVYADYNIINEVGNNVSHIRLLPFDMFLLRYLHVLYIPTATVFMRRKVIDEKIFLNTDYHYALDYEYLLRLAFSGYGFAYIPETGAVVRRYLRAKSAQFRPKQWREHLLASRTQDPVLKNAGIVKVPVGYLLMALARAKRGILKIKHGCYKGTFGRALTGTWDALRRFKLGIRRKRMYARWGFLMRSLINIVYVFKYVKHCFFRKNTYAQYGEDLIVQELIGQVKSFVDIGANDGISYSNTILFALQGARGVCFEPVPCIFDQLKHFYLLNKKVRCMNVGISHENRRGVIISTGLFSYLPETEDPAHTEHLKHLLDEKKLTEDVMLVRFEDAMRTVDMGTEIDLLSVDVEGHELQVLQSIDFDAFHFKVIIVETHVYNNHGNYAWKHKNFDRIVDLVQKNGYAKAKETKGNTIFKRDYGKDI